MKNRQLSLIASAGLLGASVFLVPQAKADDWDMLTKVTINHPFEIPGRVLPAGTYTMRRVEKPDTPDVVVFANATDQHVYEMVLALPIYRDQPSDRTVITFEERAGDAPQAIKDWWYPGRLVGEEFLYPKVKTLTASVAPPPAIAPAPPAAPIKATAPAQSQAAVAVTSENRTQEPVQIAQAQPAPVQSAPQNSQPAPKKLPKTGSEFPLLGLLGISSAGTGLLLRRKSAPVVVD